MTSPSLPAGVTVFERGWLSSNNILLRDANSAVLVDSGYQTHADQTCALVAQALGSRPLDLLVNTHLHSDHCGGNARLQRLWPRMQTWIPPGLADAIGDWDEDRLSYRPIGQQCEPFRIDGLLNPGSSHRWAGLSWEVHASAGHDPDSVILFAPAARLLISADALWEHGFGVVFPELEDIPAFGDVAATLDLIERLAPQTVIPGHGAVFSAVDRALATARRKLESFARAPAKHLRHGAKVLLKFKLLELGSVPREDFVLWAQNLPFLQGMHRRHGQGQAMSDWVYALLAELEQGGAITSTQGMLHDAA
jgi:glyoxylase-like metal-dependent hydrolase (beta-lactamase superfamily II)